ncbi:MAG: hypothetical protein R2836_09625 [Chitinophagales bacterium]
MLKGMDSLNEMFRQLTLHGDLVEQVGYSSSSEHVSTDVVGNTSATEIDSLNTIVSENGKRVAYMLGTIMSMDIHTQVIRYAKHIAKVRRLTYF